MINSRALILLGFMLLAFVLLAAKLFTIQISKHEYYALVAEKQQNKPEIDKAERGIIKDINGEVLCYTRDNVSFYADKRMMNQRRVTAIINLFSNVFGKDTSYYKSLIENGTRNIYLEKKVSMENALKLRNTVIEGLRKEVDFTRVYPYGSLASHALGYVDTELRGVAGIERICNKYLTGTDGFYFFESDVLGRVLSVNEELSQPAQPGKSVTLTINKNYQKILEEELFLGIEKFEAESAIGIIMNPNNGEILGLANYPDYDPANFKLFDPSALRNRAITDTYEPGSTMKSLVLSILLDKNLAREDEIINTENGSYSIKNVKITDSHKFASLSVREVLEQSSNIGMAKLSSRVDNEVLYKYLRDFGFSNLTSIDLPGETEGLLKKPAKFNLLTKPFLSFGYEISVTPMQMISAYSALVNGGFLMKPFIVKSISDASGNIIEQNVPTKIRNVVEKSTSDRLRNMMVGVVEYGTGTTAQLENVLVGGKTGTAQRLINNSYSSNQHNSSFIGYFPAENPKVISLILVNSPKIGKYGGLVAAPIFKEISRRMIESDPNLVPNKTVIQRNKELAQELIAEINKAPKSKTKSFSDLSDAPAKTEPRKIFNGNKSIMPDLKNQSMRDAIVHLSEIGVAYKIVGNGKVVSQSIDPGSKIENGIVCLLKCEPTLKPKTKTVN